MFALVAGFPLAIPGSVSPVPAGVVSQSVRGLTLGTSVPLAMNTAPAPDAMPHGAFPRSSGSAVAVAGPPTPPATVEMTPGTVAWPAARAAPGPASAAPRPDAAAAGTAPVTSAAAAASAGSPRRTVPCPMTRPVLIRRPSGIGPTPSAFTCHPGTAARGSIGMTPARPPRMTRNRARTIGGAVR